MLFISPKNQTKSYERSSRFVYDYIFTSSRTRREKNEGNVEISFKLSKSNLKFLRNDKKDFEI